MTTPLAANQRIYITVRAIQAGQICESIFGYASPADPSPLFTPQAIAAEWDLKVKTKWKNLLSNQVLLERLTIDIYGLLPNVGYVHSINEPGNIAADALPPWVAYSFKKQPDNANIDGTNTTPFRNGGFRLSGVPETSQVNGIIDSTSLADANVLAAQLLYLTPDDISMVAQDLLMVMYRPPLLPGLPAQSMTFCEGAYCKVALGSQNTRKF